MGGGREGEGRRREGGVRGRRRERGGEGGKVKRGIEGRWRERDRGKVDREERDRGKVGGMVDG